MISTSSIPGARFVDPKVLARIGNLELVARSVVDGFINGLHRTNVFGASVDFAEHRGYVPATTSAASTGGCSRGPIATTSRSTRPTRTRTSRCCSTCRSRWASAATALTKLDYAKMLAGCLTYLVHRQRDRVGLVAFDDDIVEHVPPSAKHMETVLHVLDRLKPTKPGSLRAPLHKMAEHFGRRGMLVVISDFYEEPDAILEALGPLRFRGNELIVFHMLDRAELEFDFDDGLGLRGPRERRADADRAAGAARGIPEDDPRPHRGHRRAVQGRADRLHA